MRVRFLFVAGLVACGSSSSSSGDDGSTDAAQETSTDVSDDAVDSNGPIDAAPPVPCAAGETCVDVDLSAKGHVISPLIFGDNVEWFQDGDHLWDPTTSSLRAPQIDLLKTAGLTLVRYPGGTLSDFFHWQEAVGPVASRKPQVDPFNSTASKTVTAAPLFGPDEFVQLTKAIGAQPLITANVGTGTADEAAAWLKDLESKGVDAKLWEIGNEIWLKDTSWAGTAQARTPLEYAGIFDAYAKALRAVDPSVRVGAIGCHPASPVSLCRDANWNQVVLSNVHEKIDFFAVHDAYSPVGVGWDADVSKIFSSMLGGAEGVRTNLDGVESDVDTYANAASKGLTIAITEHASLFVPAPSDSAHFVPQLQRNWSLAAALYSASFYRIAMSDPRIEIANHLPMNGPWQSLTTEDLSDGVSKPFRTAFFHVFRSFADGAKGTFVTSKVNGSPTFDSVDYGFVAGVKGAPSLLSLAVMGTDGKLRVWIINRDLTNDVSARVVVRNLAAPTSLVVDVIDAPTADAMNTADAPTTIVPKTSTPPPTNDVRFTFPAHSLVRFTFG